MKKKSAALLLFILFAAPPCFWSSTSRGGTIITDGSVGTGPATDLAGPDFAITAGLGSRQGTNLFHSFSTFNINAGESATFSGPASIRNIISRVTGGSPSTINGTLGSSISGANLYFLNPAGVIFGPNASLAVNGSFHVSTADYLRLGSADRFYSTLAPGSTLSTAAPAAFGFLTGSNPAPIIFRQSKLQVTGESHLSVISGDLTLDSTTLQSAEGQINIGSFASAGEVVFSSTPVTTTGFEAYGKIVITNNSLVDTSNTLGRGGNDIFIRSGRIELLGSSSIKSNAVGSGAGNKIRIRGDSLSIDNAAIKAKAFGLGTGGDISLDVNTLDIARGGSIDTSTQGAGNAGRINISAGKVSLDSGAYISGKTTAAGDGGTVLVSASDSIFLKNSARITASSTATATGSGDAGAIMLSSGNTIRLTDSWILTGAENGGGGNIRITAHYMLELINSFIATSVLGGAGDGGNITIDPVYVILDNSWIQANAFGGNGGNIDIVANSFLATPDSSITASSQLGLDGNIVIDSPDTDVSGSIAVLPSVFFDATVLLRNVCALRSTTSGSSLVIKGRGGMPVVPGGYLPSSQLDLADMGGSGPGKDNILNP